MNARAREYSSAEVRAAAVTKSANETLTYYNQVNASARTILAEQEAKIAKLESENVMLKKQFRMAQQKNVVMQ